MTLELANRQLCRPDGICKDVLVPVGKFTYPADFVVVDYVPDEQIPLILGRPFLRTARALIDVYDEKLILRDGNESLTLNMQSEKSKLNGIQKMYSGSPTIQSDDSFPSSSPMKTSDSTSEEFADEFTPPNSLPPGDDVSIVKKDFQGDTFRIISNPLFEFDDSFKSSNMNPLFEENDKDVEIKSSSSSTLTSPEASELEAYLENVSIQPGNDLNLPPILKVSSSNPTSPTLTGEKILTSLFTAELSASRYLNSLGKRGPKYSNRTLSVFKEPSFLLPPPKTPDECLKNVVLDFDQSKKTIPLHIEDVNTFAFVIWTFLPYFTYTKESFLIFSFRNFFHRVGGVAMLEFSYESTDCHKSQETVKSSNTDTENQKSTKPKPKEAKPSPKPKMLCRECWRSKEELQSSASASAILDLNRALLTQHISVSGGLLTGIHGLLAREKEIWNWLNCISSAIRRQCVVMIPFLIAPGISALVGCDRLVSEPLVIENFDVIVGMDWFPKRKVVILCHEKVVKIPLEGDGILRVHDERTQGVAKALMNAKIDEPRINDIPVVRDFTDVFLKDLLGLPTQELNKSTVKNHYPLRRIDDLFDQLQGACHFSKIDPRSGYHQLRVHENAIPKTAFRMRYGHFESTIMPFWVNQCTSGFHGLNEPGGEHEVHLKLVLESLRKEKLHAKFSKAILYWVDVLSRKERELKSVRVRGMILAAQVEAVKAEKYSQKGYVV
ncbi:putative reverse transcriptase domain-containing protein [Tanacetum coccineum]